MMTRQQESELVGQLTLTPPEILRRLLAHTVGVLADRQGVTETSVQLGRITRALAHLADA